MLSTMCKINSWENARRGRPAHSRSALSRRAGRGDRIPSPLPVRGARALGRGQIPASGVATADHLTRRAGAPVLYDPSAVALVTYRWREEGAYETAAGAAHGCWAAPEGLKRRESMKRLSIPSLLSVLPGDSRLVGLFAILAACSMGCDT